MKLRDGRVTIDGIGRSYPCKLADGLSWNGWEIPLFTAAGVRRVIKDIGAKVIRCGPTEVVFCAGDGTYQDAAFLYPGTKRYAFNGFCFTVAPRRNKGPV
jgi:hypothetical protein